jgi:two-component system, OmpR family, phosphate regulon sensor histidine kinase PhoR
MRGQAQRMTCLIDDLLSLSRIEMRAHLAPEERLDLTALVRHMVDLLTPLARERKVEVRLAVPDTPLYVRGDRDELLRVVENLVENAVKYGESARGVDVTLGIGQPAGNTPKQIELTVRDYGPGIPPEHLPRLTERFYRVDAVQSREKGGTGLGLAIVKHIANRHRGELTIESELGSGALFRVALPAIHDGDQCKPDAS